jgi:predicted nucleic acid-binding protein
VKFRRLAGRIAPLLEELGSVLRMVEGGEKMELASDPDDNRVLEAAVAGGVEYLITGNLRDYPGEWKVARIVNARHFLEETGRYLKV